MKINETPTVPKKNFDYAKYSLPYKIYETKQRLIRNDRIAEETEQYPDLFTTRIDTFRSAVDKDKKALYDLLGIEIPEILYSLPLSCSFPIVLLLIETQKSREVLLLSTISN